MTTTPRDDECSDTHAFPTLIFVFVICTSGPTATRLVPEDTSVCKLRPTIKTVFHQIRHCLCKRMNESDAKTFRFRKDSGNLLLCANGALGLVTFQMWTRPFQHWVQSKRNPRNTRPERDMKETQYIFFRTIAR